MKDGKFVDVSQLRSRATEPCTFHEPNEFSWRTDRVESVRLSDSDTGCVTDDAGQSGGGERTFSLRDPTGILGLIDRCEQLGDDSELYGLCTQPGFRVNGSFLSGGLSKRVCESPDVPRTPVGDHGRPEEPGRDHEKDTDLRCPVHGKEVFLRGDLGGSTDGSGSPSRSPRERSRSPLGHSPGRDREKDADLRCPVHGREVFLRGDLGGGPTDGSFSPSRSPQERLRSPLGHSTPKPGASGRRRHGRRFRRENGRSPSEKRVCESPDVPRTRVDDHGRPEEPGRDHEKDTGLCLPVRGREVSRHGDLGLGSRTISPRERSRSPLGRSTPEPGASGRRRELEVTPEERPFLNSEYRQSRFRYIRSIVSKYDIKSHHDVYLKLPDDEYERLLDLCGDHFEKMISNQIFRNEARRFMKQRQNCIWDNLYDTLSDGYKSLSPEERDTDGADWILQLLKANRIDCVEFFAWITLVGNRQLPKINTLVLTGPANTGKSLLLRCLLSNLHAAVITRPGDASASHGQPAWQKCYVLYEEPLTVQGTAHDTALLLGGEPPEVSF